MYDVTQYLDPVEPFDKNLLDKSVTTVSTWSQTQFAHEVNHTRGKKKENMDNILHHYVLRHTYPNTERSLPFCTRRVEQSLM